MKYLGGALETAVDGGRHPQFLRRGLNDFGGFAKRNAGRQVEGNRHARELALVVNLQGGVAGLKLRNTRQRDLLTGIGLDVNFIQRGRVQLILRIDFEDDVVLVVLFVQRRDLALAERVVQRVINHLRLDTEPGCRVTVNHNVGL